MGAFLDGIPEQAVLGSGWLPARAWRVGLLVAIFVSNFPAGLVTTLGFAVAAGLSTTS